MPPLLPHIGNLSAGPRNAITDVTGVTLGHCPLAEGDVQTGVTVVRPHAGDLFRDRVPAAAVVLNGFGKSVGLMQVDELGVLETPIALTNTFSVGAVATAQIRALRRRQPRERAQPAHGQSAGLRVQRRFSQRHPAHGGHRSRTTCTHSSQRRADFAEGSVGAGRGMSCFGLKGGIGTLRAACRRPAASIHGGRPGTGQLRPAAATGACRSRGRLIAWRRKAWRPTEPEKGSIIMLVATDAPLDARQLRRLALRAAPGWLAPVRSSAMAAATSRWRFPPAYTVPTGSDRPMPAIAMVHDGLLDPLFQAAADSTEQAILHALWRATAVTAATAIARPTLPRAPSPALRRAPRNEDPDRRRHRGRGRMYHRQQTRAGNGEYERARRWMTTMGGSRRLYLDGKSRRPHRPFGRRLSLPVHTIIVDSDGQEVLGPDCRVGKYWTVPKDGTYRLVVNGAEWTHGDVTGPYHFVFQGGKIPVPR